MRKIINTAIVLALILVLTAGCGNSAAKKKYDLRFMYWGDITEIEIINEMVAKFEKDTGLSVSAERVPAGPPYMEKVITQFAAGSAPDVMFVEAGNFKQFADKGVLLDLTPFLENETTLKKSDFYPKIIDRFTDGSSLYVLPRDIAPICTIYYNKKAFDEAGIKYPQDSWTWDDLVEIGKKLIKKDATGMVSRFGYVDDWPIWEAFVFSNGGKVVDNVKNPKKFLLDSKEAIAGIQYRADLMHKHGIMPSPAQMTGMGGMGSADMFISERAAMFYSGIWKTPAFRNIKNFEWDVVMFPKGPKGFRGFPSGGSGYSIVKSTKNKEAAWKLLTYLSGKEGQVKLAKTGLVQPAMKTMAESKDFLDGQAPKHKDVVLRGVQYAEFSPLTPVWDEISTSVLSPGLDRIWNGKETAEKVLKEIVPEINRKFFK